MFAVVMFEMICYLLLFERGVIGTNWLFILTFPVFHPNWTITCDESALNSRTLSWMGCCGMSESIGELQNRHSRYHREQQEADEKNLNLQKQVDLHVHESHGKDRDKDFLVDVTVATDAAENGLCLLFFG